MQVHNLFIYLFLSFLFFFLAAFSSGCQVKTHILHQFSKLLKGIIKSSHRAQHDLLPSKSWECLKKRKKKDKNDFILYVTWKHCKWWMFASPLFKESIRDTGGFCSVLLMAVIISKVTNAINMESSLLITQLALGLSSACFNLHNHSSDKQSFNHHTALYCDTQYSNQPIYRLSDWAPGHSEIQFASVVQWATESFPMSAQPEWTQYETTAIQLEMCCTVRFPVKLRRQQTHWE